MVTCSLIVLSDGSNSLKSSNSPLANSNFALITALTSSVPILEKRNFPFPLGLLRISFTKKIFLLSYGVSIYLVVLISKIAVVLSSSSLWILT